MNKEVMKQALMALEMFAYYFPDMPKEYNDYPIEALKEAINQEICELNVKDFIKMVEGKEDLFGRPIWWTQWPNDNKKETKNMIEKNLEIYSKSQIVKALNYAEEMRQKYIQDYEESLNQGKVEFGCKTHPDAPHGFVREASYVEGGYVCECELWELPEQDEPVAEVVEGDDFSKQVIGINNWRTLSNGTKLYTKPQRKPLTMTELSKIFASIPNVPFDGEWHLELVRAIESAHGIKE